MKYEPTKSFMNWLHCLGMRQAIERVGNFLIETEREGDSSELTIYQMGGKPVRVWVDRGLIASCEYDRGRFIAVVEKMLNTTFESELDCFRALANVIPMAVAA